MTNNFYKLVKGYIPDKKKREKFLENELGKQYLLRCLSVDVYNLAINKLNKPIGKLECYILRNLIKN